MHEHVPFFTAFDKTIPFFPAKPFNDSFCQSKDLLLKKIAIANIRSLLRHRNASFRVKPTRDCDRAIENNSSLMASRASSEKRQKPRAETRVFLLFRSCPDLSSSGPPTRSGNLLPHQSDRLRIIITTENCRARNKNVSACRCHRNNGLRTDTPIYLYLNVQPLLVNHFSQ